MKTLNKLEEILVANNILLRKEVKFTIYKNTKLKTREFEKCIDENPRLLEPGLVAIAALNILENENGLRQDWRDLVIKLRNNESLIDHTEINTKQLRWLYEVELEHLKEITPIPILSKKLILNYINGDETIFLLPEVVFVDVIKMAILRNDTKDLNMIMNFLFKYKDALRVDVFSTLLKYEQDLTKKIALIFFQKLDKRRFGKLIQEIKKNLKKNIIYQLGCFEMELIVELGIFTDLKISDQSEIKPNQLIKNRLLIGPNPRADFHTMITKYKSVTFKEASILIGVNKSALIEYIKADKLLKEAS